MVKKILIGFLVVIIVGVISLVAWNIIALREGQLTPISKAILQKLYPEAGYDWPGYSKGEIPVDEYPYPAKLAPELDGKVECRFNYPSTIKLIDLRSDTDSKLHYELKNTSSENIIAYSVRFSIRDPEGDVPPVLTGGSAVFSVGPLKPGHKAQGEIDINCISRPYFIDPLTGGDISSYPKIEMELLVTEVFFGKKLPMNYVGLDFKRPPEWLPKMGWPKGEISETEYPYIARVYTSDDPYNVEGLKHLEQKLEGRFNHQPDPDFPWCLVLTGEVRDISEDIYIPWLHIEAAVRDSKGEIISKVNDMWTLAPPLSPNERFGFEFSILDLEAHQIQDLSQLKVELTINNAEFLSYEGFKGGGW